MTIPQNKLSLNSGKDRCVAAARCVASGSGYASAMELITPDEEKYGNSWNALRKKQSWVMMMGETLKITTEEQRF
uniref:Uncharacterized protein n=1 Tax=Brassica campestris TaxID=3711 RepID=M4EJ01_BRACM